MSEIIIFISLALVRSCKVPDMKMRRLSDITTILTAVLSAVGILSAVWVAATSNAEVVAEVRKLSEDYVELKGGLTIRNASIDALQKNTQDLSNAVKDINSGRVKIVYINQDHVVMSDPEGRIFRVQIEVVPKLVSYAYEASPNG